VLNITTEAGRNAEGAPKAGKGEKAKRSLSRSSTASGGYSTDSQRDSVVISFWLLGTFGSIHTHASAAASARELGGTSAGSSRAAVRR
jgi:hypothetical protein